MCSPDEEEGAEFAVPVSLHVADLLPNVFSKKSKMLAELLPSSHSLFLNGPPAAPGVHPAPESLKYLDPCDLEVPEVENFVFAPTDEDVSSRLVKTEEVLNDDGSVSLLVSVLELENGGVDLLRSAFWNRS